MARYMRAGPLEIRQLFHLHGQDSEPRRDVEQMVAVIGYDRACSRTIQPGFWTGLREYPACHLCLKNGAKSNAIMFWSLFVDHCMHARSRGRANTPHLEEQGASPNRKNKCGRGWPMGQEGQNRLCISRTQQPDCSPPPPAPLHRAQTPVGNLGPRMQKWTIQSYDCRLQ